MTKKGPFRLILAMLLVGSSFLGCSQPQLPLENPARPVFLDRQLVRSMAWAFADLDHGSTGQIKLGHGWLQPEYESRIKRWSMISWAGLHATFFFAKPLIAEVDLVLECAGPSATNRPPQTVNLTINEQEFASFELSARFKEFRAAIPENLLSPGLNRIDLEFNWAAARPATEEANDQRKRAAAFRSIAIVERGLAQRRSSSIDPTENTMLLMPGSPMILPLPPGSSVLKLGEIDCSESGGDLTVGVLDRSARETTLWQGPCQSAAGQSIPVEPVGPGHAELVLRFESDQRSHQPIALKVEIDVTRPDRGAERRPDIFVYLIDTLRADALEPWGCERATSPRINEFADDAVVFRQTSSTSAFTLPATMSALTGLSPHRHRYTNCSRRPTTAVAAMLPAMLGETGYETLAISQSKMVSSVFGFDRGFDTFLYSDALSRGRLESGDVRWFLWRHLLSRADPQRPLFTYLHTVDPHAPYNPVGSDRRFTSNHPGQLRPWKYEPQYFMNNELADAGREVAHMRALYDGEVRHADREFGAFIDMLEYLGLYDDSLVILLSDHGEEFAEHGGFGHSRSLFEELVHVPLIVKFPQSWQGGTTVDARTSIVDIVPTVLDVLGIEYQADDFEGISLVDLARTPDGTPEREIWAELKPGPGPNRAPVDLISLTIGARKCVLSNNAVNAFAHQVATHRAYDLATDPTERSPLPADSSLALTCVDRLDARREEMQSAGRLPSEALSDEERAALQALGYVE